MILMVASEAGIQRKKYFTGVSIEAIVQFRATSD